MKKPRQGRHIREIIRRWMEMKLVAEDVAPDGAGKLFWSGFYKDAAPTALGERRDAENDTASGVCSPKRHTGTVAKAQRSTGGEERARGERAEEEAWTSKPACRIHPRLV